MSSDHRHQTLEEALQSVPWTPLYPSTPFPLRTYTVAATIEDFALVNPDENGRPRFRVSFVCPPPLHAGGDEIFPLEEDRRLINLLASILLLPALFLFDTATGKLLAFKIPPSPDNSVVSCE